MQIISINTGTARVLEGRSFNGETGIFKDPVTGPVRIGALGLDGDAVLNQKHHGGPDQAVYLYRQEDYDWWSAELGRKIEPGTFGENLTLEGLPAADLDIGSRLEFSEVILEATAPRIPCNTLAERMGDPGFARQFVRAERSGIYCRVLTTGTVHASESFALTAPQDASISTLDMFRGRYRKLDRRELERFLAAPIDVRSRTDYQQQLDRHDGQF